MRAWPALALALIATGCTDVPLALPDEPLARATVCTAVRSLELRSGRTGEGPISFQGQTEILQIAMVFSAEGAGQVEVDGQKLSAVSNRTPTVIEEIRGQNWATLIEPCNTAFPETQRDAAALPNDAFEGGMTCFALADYLSRAAADHPAERAGLIGLAARALSAAQPGLRQRARNDAEAQRIASGYAARAFKAGRPVSLLSQCRRKFPVGV